MGHDLNKDETIRRKVILYSPVIAIVGRSDDHYYTSYQVGEYLIQEGFIVYNVNPNLEDIDGEKVYKSLKDIPEKINIVDVFRRSDFLPEVVQAAIDIGAETAWAQLGIKNEDARLLALGAGLNYAENICLRTEHERLFKGIVHG